jgi:hypothetical protein
MFGIDFSSRKVFSWQVGNISHGDDRPWTIDNGKTMVDGQSSIVQKGIIFSMLPDLQLKDHLRLRKPHPCGSYEWTVVRLGADIGLECKGCQHRVMLTRRELAKRMKTNLSQQEREKQRDSEENKT